MNSMNGNGVVRHVEKCHEQIQAFSINYTGDDSISNLKSQQHG